MFLGESVDDCGGGYSESIAEMCEELQNGLTPLLIVTPNGRDESGANRDCFLLNPAAKSPLHISMFRFLGTFCLCLPLWKCFLGLMKQSKICIAVVLPSIRSVDLPCSLLLFVYRSTSGHSNPYRKSSKSLLGRTYVETAGRHEPDHCRSQWGRTVCVWVCVNPRLYCKLKLLHK